ncbi:MAG: hypothetical protein ABIG44_11290 [Planctomycetota bacterium]
MFLRCHSRKKNGKLHRYWSVVESRRVAGGEPTAEQAMILETLKRRLPPQPPPRIRAGQLELPAAAEPPA